MKTNNQVIISIVVILLLIGGYFLFKKPNTEQQTPISITGIENSVHYSCSNGNTMDAVFGEDAVSLALSDGRSVVLPQTVSASGVRYEQGSIIFVGKGDNAFLQEGDKVTYENCVVNTTPVVLGDSVFTDQGKTISFSYPKESVLSGGDIGYTQSWRTNTQSLGIVLAKVTIPKSTQPETNFSEAVFTVGTSSDATEVKNCLIPRNGERAKGIIVIDGVTYNKITLTEAGAGNYYDTTSYRVIKNNQCYAVEYTIHSTNFASYDPNLGIKEFDTQKVVNALETMVGSFKFLGTTATETTVTPLTLIEDSRCPEGVQCVWEGTVKITIKVTNKNGTVGTSDISLGETKNIAGVFVTFKSVSPAKTQKVLKFTDYKFDFSIK